MTAAPPRIDFYDLFAPPPRLETIPDLETLLTHPDWFGLTTATPVQRALCRVIHGVPLGDLVSDEDVLAAFGGHAAITSMPSSRCKELVLLAAIRCGKSLICAAASVHAALTCDVSVCGPGEMPRVSVMSLDKDKALATWTHIRGRVEASPRLRAFLIGSPTAWSLKVRHPSGVPVEISVVAGSRAAGSVGSRWSAGVILDEAPRMVGEEDGVVNIDNVRTAVAGRLLPGAQIFMPGSPWAPYGPIYKLHADYFGKPSENIVVMHATGPQMNPVIWTPEAVEELRLRKPDAYETDCMARFLDPESGLLASWELDSCVRRDAFERLTIEGLELPGVDECFARAPVKGDYYVATIDPATRGNAWALTILGCSGPGRYYVAFARQWVGSTASPLSPSVVFAETALLLKPYGLGSAFSDQWAADALVELAAKAGLWITPETVTGPIKLEMMTTLKAHVTDRTLELPPLLPFLRDLASVRKKVTATGVQIVYPLTGDGRHCDYAPTIGLALRHAPRTPDAPPPLAPGMPGAAEQAAAEAKERARLEVERANKRASRQWGRAY